MTTIKPASIINPVTPIGDNGSIFVPFTVDTYSGDKGALRTSLPIDRGGHLVFLYYGNSLGNTADTVQVSYTVPSGKYAILQNIYLSIGIPTTSGECRIKVAVNGYNIAGKSIDSTTRFDNRIVYSVHNIYLPSNTIVSVYTYNSTTSTVYFYISIIILEFSC